MEWFPDGGDESRARHVVPDDVAAVGLERVLVLCTPGQEATGRQVADTLGARATGVLPVTRMHVPIKVVDDTAARVAALGTDGCVTVGGCSAIGLGKAVALRHDLPVVAVPTTYAGSEMTPIWGITEGGAKRTGRDPRVLPVSVVYDPELTLSLPTDLSVTSGMNAIAHAVEALYAPDASPMTNLMAEEGARDGRGPARRGCRRQRPRRMCRGPVRRLAVRRRPPRRLPQRWPAPSAGCARPADHQSRRSLQGSGRRRPPTVRSSRTGCRTPPRRRPRWGTARRCPGTT